MDLRQTPEYTQYMQRLGWSVIRCQISGSGCQVFVKKIPLIGRIAKLQRPSVLPKEEEIDKFAKRHKTVVFYLEPDIKKSSTYLVYTKYISSIYHDFSPAKNCFLSSKTIQINLRKNQDEILARMDKKTRYEIRLAGKNGIKVKESRDIGSFAKHWQTSARQRWMFFSQKKEIKALFSAFGPKAHILFAHPKLSTVNCQLSTVLGGVLLVRTSTSAHYMYAFSTPDGNRLSAPSLLVWEALKLAKSRGCKIFDFEGIYDQRYFQTKSWKGFTKFKKGFGGEEITYPPTLVKYYNPIAKLLKL